MVQPKILVLGDLIIDEYIYGSCTRISPEAPVPVVTFDKSVMVLGGAGNVVENLKALGAEVQFWCDTKTCHKTRILAGHQQVVRLDRDDLTEVSPPPDLHKMVEWADVVLISDYNKGVINSSLLAALEKVFALCRKPLLVDPYNGKFRYMARPTLIKPNRAEAESIVEFKIKDKDSLIMAGQQYLKKSGAENCVITLGAEGMALFDRHRYWDEPFSVASKAQQVFDVTGAGDTTIAVLAYVWASSKIEKLSKAKAVSLANYAAGIVCSKLGTAVVTHKEIFGN